MKFEKIGKNRKVALFLFGLMALCFAIFYVWKTLQKSGFYPIAQRAKRGDAVESVYAIGTVNADREFSLKVAIPTTAQKILVREGEKVKMNQPLVSLVGIGTISSPFSGTITHLPVKVGETFAAQTEILHVMDLDDRYIKASLEQRGALKVVPRQKVQVSFEGMRVQVFTGIVESIYSNQGNFLVKVSALALPPQILPGMTADLAIVIREYKDILLVPVMAIHEGKVLVKRQRKVPYEIPVKVGLISGSMAEVVSGDINPDEVFYKKGSAVE